ncbi:NAD(P)/FAD-dependent oxidoreductase [Paraburkholderia caballeronis]|uniref:NAD(P)/FAD-dependent oxidoreductase n=1 Tax=Paraburkholderia caballeronis TaxID=416943 RepID=UPI001064A7F8|nr:FAD-binding oxidoreductase [Paraburkholderia caballeronis]TDV15672.1 glycine/D-amino acid oxidase-like deaminating enzyme [Paraburkholderia caballeronis]TDV17927.1 glycine/D-amino acid oxidase-like deaminating enzyme [Paraburkholderia caballeronis]TDV26459.1 glycine/D-amino acid oxidase-like deaminating enzyme [Paraburkholderia caballeronis]
MSVAAARAPFVLPRARVDIAVIGGGIVGLCTAGFLASAGCDVMLLDAGGSAASTANAGSLHVQMQSRFMRLFPDRVAGMERQLLLYPKAVAFWKEFERALDADFELKVSGGLMVAETPEQFEFLVAKSRRERELGLATELVGRDELARLAPYLGPHAIGAELCANEGKLNPLKCNAFVRAWAKRAGVEIVDRCRVDALASAGASRDAGFTLTTAGGALAARRVVVAAGPGARALMAGVGALLPVDPEPLHMNITEAVPPLILHLVQHAERSITLKQLSTGQVVIGGGWPARLAPGSEYPVVDPESLAGNLALAQFMVPALAPLQVIRCWAGLNSKVDGRGVLGEMPDVPGLYAAVPGDAGYTLGPLSARLVADIVLGRDPGEDMAPYAPDRFAHERVAFSGAPAV